MKLPEISGKVALVVGGSRGIGAAVTCELLTNGCRTAFTHYDPPEYQSAVTELHRFAESHRCDSLDAAVDCTNCESTSEFVKKILDTWKQLDFLVFCAGYTSRLSFNQLTIDQWRRVVDINLNGAFIATQAVLPAMASQKYGAIVLIGSAATRTGGGGRADYVSAKAGLEGLNLAITREYASQGIRCNLVHPSLIETDLLRHRYPDPAQRDKAAQGVPIGRLGQPEDVSHVACFLLSVNAGYITGQSILVDGGRTYCA